jgi:hypothetical protein
MKTQEREFDLSSHEISQLSDDELDVVFGGGVSLNFTHVKYTYKQQSAAASTTDS